MIIGVVIFSCINMMIMAKWKWGRQKEDWSKEYDILIMMVWSMQFSSWTNFLKKVGKRDDWLARVFKPWMEQEHKEMYNHIWELLNIKKGINKIDKAKANMEWILEDTIDAKAITKIYRDSVMKEIEWRSNEKVKKMLDYMENDLLVTRSITMQACMLAVTWYFQSIQKRVKDGKEVYAKEFKTAYEILKTEMGEPTSIKESRVKNLQVSLEVPVDKDDVKRILASSENLDLSIEVAEEFKEEVESKLNLNQ